MRLSNHLSIFLFLVLPIYGALLSIDFGQEFTKAALVAPGVPFDIILTTDTKRKDTSGLTITKIPGSKDQVQRNFGSHALSSCVRQPSSCLLHLKSILGKSVNDQDSMKYIKNHPSVELTESKNNRNSISFKVSDQSYPIEEVLAMSLEEIKNRAEQHWNEASSTTAGSITDVVITVPSFFGQAQRLAIKDAAEISGMEVVALVDDGLAVALNYASTREFNETKQYHLIYDMGAGSTKATLVSFSSLNGTLNVETEGYGSDDRMGGHLFTESIKEILESKFLASNPHIKLSKFASNARAMNRLWQAAEKAKLVLSANTETKVSVESLYDDIDFKTLVTRDEFEEYISDNIFRFTKPVIEALLKVDLKNISSVILAGGSTRVPIVQKHLITFLGNDELISKNVNADEAAVLGATLKGLSLSGMFRTKQIETVEHSVSSYQIKYFDDGEEKKASLLDVFPRGSISINNRTAVELVTLSGKKDFEVDLYEDGELFTQFNFKNNEYNETVCPGGLKYFANFDLSESRIFDLKSVTLSCYPTPIDDETKEEAEKVAEVRPKKTILTSKPKYAYYRPMGVSTKQQSATKLKDLTRKDKQRLQREELINKLEASLYDLRSYLDDEDVIAKGPSKMVESAQAALSEYLEWLDYDSGDSTTKEIQEKHDDIKVRKIKLETYVKLSDTLLELSAFDKLSEEALQAVFNVQDFILSMKDDALDMKSKFDENGFDFEEASKSIKVAVPEVTEDQLNSHFSKLNEFNDLIKRFKSGESSFEETSKDALFDLRESIMEELKELEIIHSTLKKVHNTRISGLKDKLNKLLKKKAKIEKKLSSASAVSLESETETETATQPTDESSSTATTTTSTTSVHDEL